MSERNPCEGCPRDILFQEAIDRIAALREYQQKGAEQMLDEDNLRELAEILHQQGLLEDPDDLDSLRENIASVFEFLDAAEAANHEQRANEMRLCVGALKMRAKSGATQYDVTLCRLPGHNNSNSTELARVMRTNI